MGGLWFFQGKSNDSNSLTGDELTKVNGDTEPGNVSVAVTLVTKDNSMEMGADDYGKIFKREGKPLSPTGAFFVGIVYAIAFLHCIGSLLAGMLVYAGSKGTTGGAFALFLFSIGLAIPYLITALAISSVIEYLKKIKQHI